jgi:hypothetical protein
VMKRALLFFVLAAACVSALPATADAKAPCRNAIYNDWYKDGQIASTYPLGCYRDALTHVRQGDAIYTSLEDDIRAALQAAIARGHGKKVADQVGHKFSSQPVLVDRQPKKNDKSIASEGPGRGDTHDDAVAVADTTGGSSGVPLPLILLGGLALLLIAAGGAGVLIRRRRSGPAV